LKEITSYEHFKQVIASETPVIVKFGAPWCGPCKTIEPVLEAVESEGYDVYKLNIDTISEPALDYRVMGVPVVFAFRNGNVLKKFIGGSATTEQIKNLIVEE
jgi:thioredoxin 1